MKLGIYGRPGSGRRTVFEALGAGLKAEEEAGKGRRSERMAVVQVPEARLGPLAAIYRPKKVTPARITLTLPDETISSAQILAQLSIVDGLLFILANYDPAAADPAADLKLLEEELILRDLGVAEGVYEKMRKGRSKGQDFSAREIGRMEEVLEVLGQGRPIRARPDLAAEPALRSYAFLSAKPRLMMVNNPDGDNSAPDLGLDQGEETLVLQGQIERELARMEPDEAVEFRTEYGLLEPGLDRLVRAAYGLMGLISFLTVGPDEVRAWPLKVGSTAVAAAGTIHSDLEKGFIRAEVVPFTDLVAAGSMAEAKKRGLVRLEGKDYLVVDGDVITVRFNV